MPARAFVRVENGRIITVAVNESTTATELKDLVKASGQSTVAPEDMELYVIGTPMEPEGLLSDYTARDPAKLHIRLFRRDQGPLPPPISAGPNAPAPVTAPIEFTLAAGIVLPPGTAPEAFVQVCTWRDEPVRGSTSYDVARGVVKFSPAEPLAPGTTYAVYFDGQCTAPASQLSASCFDTVTLGAVRLLVRGEPSRPPKLIAIAREQQALYKELTQKAATRLKLDSARIAGWHVERDGEEIGVVRDNRGVCGLEETDLLTAVIGEAVVDDGRYVHHDVPLLEHDEYVRHHWVSDEAGFYVLSGKLDAKEEMEVILALVDQYGHL